MSTPVVHWILYPAKKRWHAWRHGARASICGTLSLAHLQEKPADRVVDHLDDDMSLCGTCKRFAGQDGAVASWIGFIRRYVKRQHCQIPALSDVQAIAELLTETGPPDDPAAVELFEDVKRILLTPIKTRSETGRERMKLVGLKEALALLPAHSGSLAAVAAIFRAWRNIMGRAETGHFRPDRVIEVMLQVPEPEAYLKYLKTKGLEPLGVAFHPNVLERAKKEPSLRGLFNGGSEYWKRTADQLNVVTDD